MMKARAVAVICQRLLEGCDGGLVNGSLGESVPVDDGSLKNEFV